MPPTQVPFYTHCRVASRLSHHAEIWKPPRSQSSGVGSAGAEAASVTVGRGRPGGLRPRWTSGSGSGNEGEDGRGARDYSFYCGLNLIIIITTTILIIQKTQQHYKAKWISTNRALQETGWYQSCRSQIPARVAAFAPSEGKSKIK